VPEAGGGRQDGAVAPRPVLPELPLGFAHRGARAERRENTIDSFRRALELGAGGLESDAWVTRDGVVVLDHDGVVRTGWRRRSIRRSGSDRLPAHIPRLSELYRRCGREFQLSLDLKDLAAAPAVIQVAEAAGAVERLWLCTDRLDVLTSWRSAWPRVRLVASTRRARLGPEVLADLGQRQVDAVNLRSGEWDPALVARVHGSGLLAFAWDAQTARRLDALLEAGIDGVYSDHVERMLEALARHQSSRD
jgi:glycerophosphoryl diester phosphodiesterase